MAGGAAGAAVPRCRTAAALRCSPAALLQCRTAAVPRCRTVAALRCSPAALLQGRTAAVMRCCSAGVRRGRSCRAVALPRRRVEGADARNRLVCWPQRIEQPQGFAVVLRGQLRDRRLAGPGPPAPVVRSTCSGLPASTPLGFAAANRKARSGCLRCGGRFGSFGPGRLPIAVGQVSQLDQMSPDKARAPRFVQGVACDPVGAPPTVPSAGSFVFHSGCSPPDRVVVVHSIGRRGDRAAPVSSLAVIDRSRGTLANWLCAQPTKRCCNNSEWGRHHWATWLLTLCALRSKARSKPCDRHRPQWGHAAGRAAR